MIIHKKYLNVLSDIDIFYIFKEKLAEGPEMKANLTALQ